MIYVLSVSMDEFECLHDCIIIAGSNNCYNHVLDYKLARNCFSCAASKKGRGYFASSNQNNKAAVELHCKVRNFNFLTFFFPVQLAFTCAVYPCLVVQYMAKLHSYLKTSMLFIIVSMTQYLTLCIGLSLALPLLQPLLGAKLL